MRTLEIHDVARATSCIVCALEMRNSNGCERPKGGSLQFFRDLVAHAMIACHTSVFVVCAKNDASNLKK